MSQDICQVNVIHVARIAIARKGLPDRERVAGLAAVFKLLGDPGRLKILLALNACEMCVCDLAALMETTPSAISHQLRLLRTAGLVQARKEGKMVYYSIGENSLQPLLTAGLKHLEKEGRG